jgi:hypothetical protein
MCYGLPTQENNHFSNDLVYIDKLAVERIEECSRFGFHSILAHGINKLMVESRVLAGSGRKRYGFVILPAGWTNIDLTALAQTTATSRV